MSDEDSISAAFQAVSKQIGDGGLNLLINNAAINKPASPAPLSVTGKKDMMEVYETNVVGPFLLAKVGLSYSFCAYSVHTHTYRCKYIDRNRSACCDDEKGYTSGAIYICVCVHIMKKLIHMVH